MFGESILSGLVSGLTNGLFATYGIQEQGRQNEALAAQQNDYNLDMWRLQNEYNSPQAQMRRLAAAGLNPNLMYGMGTTGNASQAPQKNAPAPVDYQKYAENLAKAFNIENLRTIVANRKEAEENARRAKYVANSTRIDSLRNSDIYDAEIALGSDYDYDPNTGKYSFVGTNGVSNVRKIPAGMGKYFMQQKLAENYQRSELIPVRAKLYGSQDRYLQPQIHMANYESSHYPTSYWIGQGSKAIHGLSEFSGMFNPSRYLMPLRGNERGYLAPTGRVYYY